jgi:hypothetical protein
MIHDPIALGISRDASRCAGNVQPGRWRLAVPYPFARDNAPSPELVSEGIMITRKPQIAKSFVRSPESGVGRIE